MTRTPKGQKKSDARMEVESIVLQYLCDANIEFESIPEATLPAYKEDKVNVAELSKQMGRSEFGVSRSTVYGALKINRGKEKLGANTTLEREKKRQEPSFKGLLMSL